MNKKIIGGIMITVLLIVIGYFVIYNNGAETNGEIGITVVETGNQQVDQVSVLTLIVPEDYEGYKQAMIDFTQVGGTDPLPMTQFVTKEVSVPFTNDKERISAELAANQFPMGGGPEKVSVLYFKKLDNTAYIVLNIDVDGWAGVSVALATIHPLVEKTLLYFEDISNVVFGYAPGESPVR